MDHKSQWMSSTGFILASAGSAIGLGAIWKFPYMAGQYGGGAFLLLFLLFTILIGLPLLMMEFSIGKLGQTYTTALYDKLTGYKLFNLIGWNGNLAVFILFAFYSVIGGWIIIYIGRTLLAFVNIIQPQNAAASFNWIISTPWTALLGQFLFIAITALIVSMGVEKGIERASKWMMPLLFLLFIVIIIRSLTLEGAAEGVRYFLTPRFEDITFESIVFALGQSFFALSLGTTGMITYATYLNKEANIGTASFSIVIMNLLVSIMAGLAIFPATASFHVKPEQGPGLLFIVLPQIFNHLAFGNVFYLLFLILFLFAALTSSISLLELNISNVTKNDNSQRRRWSLLLSGFIIIAGIPAALSFGVLNDIRFGAGTIFDNMDYLVSNILMPLGALTTTIACGHFMDKDAIISQFNSKTKTISVWFIAIKYILPAVILLVFIMQFI
ncbi:sodium-dependent transporter [Macrococcus equipercicus]|uniref:Transporter n=1 Tax=Macrococcus equipercicus TaxID=69967 RepID=A0ABQ6R8L7_9STAP|nr:sodium-dependent transporter [Macrococcus equipercicus]KAA1039473.1 sodium-dependent transporter [Macrococcus equipercicus]